MMAHITMDANSLRCVGLAKRRTWDGVGTPCAWLDINVNGDVLALSNLDDDDLQAIIDGAQECREKLAEVRREYEQSRLPMAATGGE